MDTRALSQIEIVYRNTAASLTYAQARSGKRLSLGCEEGCDVVIHGDYVSRCHAYIEIDGSDFLLVDASTNGSFVQTEDEQVEFVHRGHIRL